MKRPDFFIVGAPKCGTTAMYAYLRQHPAVFMPFLKEPLYFGSDLTTRYGRMSEHDYLALFEDARPDQRVGEASAWYLYSTNAAREIAAFAPQALIIVQLRNPVDMMYAQHSQLLFNAQEDIVDFAAALEAEPRRRAGRDLPPGPLRSENLYYRAAARFAEQLERYLEAFGRERVHVVLYDDFRDDTSATVREVFRFLDVDDEFRPAISIVNENKRVRSGRLQRAVFAPPGPIRALIPLFRRYPVAHRLRAAVLRANSAARRRPPLAPELRARLTDEFRPEVERLEALLGLDLGAWKVP